MKALQTLLACWLIVQHITCSVIDNAWEEEMEEAFEDDFAPLDLARERAESAPSESFSCGRTNVYAEESRIIRGKGVPKYGIPWQVLLLNQDRDRDLICGGTFISPYVVLTAAQCITMLQRPIVVFRENFRNEKNDGEQEHEIECVKVHEMYNMTRNYNDIAVIILKNPVEIVHGAIPACLPTRKHRGRKFVVSGWGVTKHNSGRTSSKLKSTTVFGISGKKCRKIYKGLGISKRQMCAGIKKGRAKGSCAGDLGGPLTITKKGITTVVGISSTVGYVCGTQNHPGIYTKVSAYLKWIKKNTAFKGGDKPKCPKPKP